jgi:FKBP-type peptidyl-prolyl cis-trans isomerase SlyD
MIAKGMVVSMTYTLTNAEGEELDKAGAHEPFAYLHGSGNIIPGLEEALEGLTKGDAKTVTVEPKNAYGEVNPALRLKVPRTQFPKDEVLAPGMRFHSEMPDGQIMAFTILQTDADNVLVDGNHPLAGQTLTFDVAIVDVRNATMEEMAHGHVHGPGGHHH